MKAKFLLAFLLVASSNAFSAWEYKVNQYQTHGLNTQGAAFLQKQYNELGKIGWELVSMTYDGETGQFLTVFKRKVTDEGVLPQEEVNTSG